MYGETDLIALAPDHSNLQPYQISKLLSLFNLTIEGQRS